jgi:hypothetical protein
MEDIKKKIELILIDTINFPFLENHYKQKIEFLENKKDEILQLISDNYEPKKKQDLDSLSYYDELKKLRKK